MLCSRPPTLLQQTRAHSSAAWTQLGCMAKCVGVCWCCVHTLGAWVLVVHGQQQQHCSTNTVGRCCLVCLCTHTHTHSSLSVQLGLSHKESTEAGQLVTAAVRQCICGMYVGRRVCTFNTCMCYVGLLRSYSSIVSGTGGTTAAYQRLLSATLSV